MTAARVGAVVFAPTPPSPAAAPVQALPATAQRIRATLYNSAPDASFTGLSASAPLACMPDPRVSAVRAAPAR